MMFWFSIPLPSSDYKLIYKWKLAGPEVCFQLETLILKMLSVAFNFYLSLQCPNQSLKVTRILKYYLSYREQKK